MFGLILLTLIFQIHEFYSGWLHLQQWLLQTLPLVKLKFSNGLASYLEIIPRRPAKIKASYVTDILY